MKDKLVSIIIPALNEEKYLPKILECIKNQTYQNYEVIVAISPETNDKTTQIAQKYNAKICKGGLYAQARNNGARIARGKILFFFDADDTFGPDAIERALKLIDKRSLDYGVFAYRYSYNLEGLNLLARMYETLRFFIFNAIFTVIITTASMFYRITNGNCLFVRADLFKKIKGFNEKVEIAEDFDFGKRAGKYGKYGRLPILVWSSNRRIKAVGFYRYIFIAGLTFLFETLNVTSLHRKIYKRRIKDRDYIIDRN
ncbi:glycosyltransferase [Candidatus Dojkabacteria bacterium]|nr:glycosyltransferase [Candidatus Dojkabacteria bacterium]